MSDWRSWGYFPKSAPRAAKGGIRAQSQRGAFGQSWWAKRWIAVLEGFNLGARLQRGRSYARRGQVLSIAIGTGTVEAYVQGSRPQPYKVTIEVKPLSKKDWQKLVDVVSSQAIYGAKLLGGEMPQDIEEAFQTAGLSLFPERYNDLKTNCSCPDWSNPCKHIAAVYYLLGEEFDSDPFLVFQLRGMPRPEFLALLGESASAGSGAKREKLPPEPLPFSSPAFWTGPPLPDHLIGDVSLSPAGAALPRRLGKFPFWQGRENLHDALEPIYRSAASRAAQAISEDIPLKMEVGS
jgi:uncharacterized Zn finger protein